MAQKSAPVPPDEVTDGFVGTEREKLLAEKIRQLQEALEDAQRQNSEKDVELQEVKQEVQQLKTEGSGWLITTPNVMYDGVTLGVQFSNGTAFVPDSRVFPSHVAKPLKDTEIEKMKPEQREAILERQKIPSSVLVAREMEDIFGYTVQHFDGSGDGLQQIISERAKERARLQAMIDQMGGAGTDNLVQPTRFGVVTRG